MKLVVDKCHGLADNIMVTIGLREIEDAYLHVSNWDALNRGNGMVRWRGKEELRRSSLAMEARKYPVREHLRRLGVVDDDGKPFCRVVAIGSRNLGNNYGVVAWHRKHVSALFHLKGEPINSRSYSCLVKTVDGELSIYDLEFSNDRVAIKGGGDITDSLDWCCYGQQILQGGEPTEIRDKIHEYYDARHILAIDPLREGGDRLMQEIYEGQGAIFDYDLFRDKIVKKWVGGVPRSRYLHNCVGLSEKELLILQKEGTPEELAWYLKEQGAENAIILDNGGSVGFWAWWVESQGNEGLGGFVYTAPDYRPNASAIIAFRVAGPTRIILPPANSSAAIV